MVREKSAPTRSSSRQVKPTEKAVSLLREKSLRTSISKDGPPLAKILVETKAATDKSPMSPKSPNASKNKMAAKSLAAAKKTASVKSPGTGKRAAILKIPSVKSPLSSEGSSRGVASNGTDSGADSPSRKKVGRPRKVAKVVEVTGKAMTGTGLMPLSQASPLQTQPYDLSVASRGVSKTLTAQPPVNVMHPGMHAAFTPPQAFHSPATPDQDAAHQSRRKQVFPSPTDLVTSGTNLMNTSNNVQQRINSLPVYPGMTNAQAALRMMPPPPTPPMPVRMVINTAQEKQPQYMRIESAEQAKDTNLRPMAQILLETGHALVSQQAFRDLLKVQRRKKPSDVQKKEEDDISELHRQSIELAVSFQHSTLACNRCDFKTESSNVLELHKEYAHFSKGHYHCPFCEMSTKIIHEFFQHMVDEHKRRGRIHMKKSHNSCPFCQFECTFKSKFNKHVEKCSLSYVSEHNLEPTPADCDIPLKKFKKKKKRSDVPEVAGQPVSIASGMPVQMNHDALIQQVAANVAANVSAATQAAWAQQAPNMAANIAAATQAWAQQSPNGLPTPMLGTAGTGQTPAPMYYYNTPGGPVYTMMQPSALTSPIAYASPGSNGVAMANSPYGILSLPKSWPSPSESTPTSNLGAPETAAESKENEKEETSKQKEKSPDIPEEPVAEPTLHKCEVCDAMVKDQESLRIHLRWAHQTNIHRNVFEQQKGCQHCPYCEEIFWTSQGLSRHKMKSHGAQWYAEHLSPQGISSCLICEEKFEDIVHHLEESHKVTVNSMKKTGHCMLCGKIPGVGDPMVSHLYEKHLVALRHHTKALANNHTPPTPQPLRTQPFCSGCKEHFTSIELYSVHCKTAHNMQCPVCPMKFCNMTGLAEHCEQTHGTKKTQDWTCNICKDVYKNEKLYLEHMSKKHSEASSQSAKKVAVEESEESGSNNDEEAENDGVEGDDDDDDDDSSNDDSNDDDSNDDDEDDSDSDDSDNLDDDDAGSGDESGSGSDSSTGSDEDSDDDITAEEGEEDVITMPVDSEEEKMHSAKKRKLHSKSRSPSKTSVLDLDGKKIVLASDDKAEKLSKRKEKADSKEVGFLAKKRKAESKPSFVPPKKASKAGEIDGETILLVSDDDEEEETKQKRKRKISTPRKSK